MAQFGQPPNDLKDSMGKYEALIRMCWNFEKIDSVMFEKYSSERQSVTIDIIRKLLIIKESSPGGNFEPIYLEYIDKLISNTGYEQLKKKRPFDSKWHALSSFVKYFDSKSKHQIFEQIFRDINDTLKVDYYFADSSFRPIVVRLETPTQSSSSGPQEAL